MGKIKIHEIAKKLNLTSKEVLEIAKKLNIDAKSHLSGVEEEQAEKIEKEALKGNKEKEETPKKEAKKEVKKENKKEEKKETPVIIRREVIIQDEKEEGEKKEIKKDERRNNIGFVERKNNKDYNIVYRNKPNKPMTVSELFGLKKEEKEKPKQEEQVKTENTKTEENKVIVNEEKNKQKMEDVHINTVQNIEKTNNNETKNNMKTNIQKENKNNNMQRNEQNNNRNNNQFKNQQYKNEQNNRKNNFNKNNKFNNRNNNDRYGKRPLDEKGIEKNIKNIMSSEMPEKEVTREYNNRNIDKQKNNSRFEESKTKRTKSRKNNNNNFDEGKLKTLKQASKLSSMFDEQDGGMLDYYDLTTERGRRGKKKKQDNGQERTKQKIFQLTSIEIPETITVKDLAAEMKKTTAEVIKK